MYVISFILIVYTDYVLQTTSFTFFLINCLKSCLFFLWTLASFLLYKNVSKYCFVFITYFLFYPVCIELKHEKKNSFFFLLLKQGLAMCPVWPGTHYVDSAASDLWWSLCFFSIPDKDWHLQTCDSTLSSPSHPPLFSHLGPSPHIPLSLPPTTPFFLGSSSVSSTWIC